MTDKTGGGAPYLDGRVILIRRGGRRPAATERSVVLWHRTYKGSSPPVSAEIHEANGEPEEVPEGEE